ncbi:MAG: aminopeptidase P family protein [Peptococcaceae bacterium]|nr:aminopeptidase P family protein [Peptococcaceae bacterium]
MLKEKLDAFFISKPENIFFFSGFTGSSGWLLVTYKDILLITDFRYEQQGKEQSPHAELIVATESIFDVLAGKSASYDLNSLGAEGSHLTYQFFCKLEASLSGIEIRPIYGLIEEIRVIKDYLEIERIAAASELTDRGMAHIFPFIREGVSEAELALEIEYFFKKSGAQGLAFEMIIASGPRAAMPHGTASPKRIINNELLTMDFGALLAGYNSDLTRTVAIGKKTDKMEEIYNIVLEAQQAGLDAVREGVRASLVDTVTREIIKKHGYGDFFGHSTGHGLGLEIHEDPRISAKNDAVLKKNMVITVEPGIYLPGWGGIRIEDTVVVEENGCRILTKTPKKELFVLG